MAESELTEDCDDNMTCSVCLEGFKFPKVLSCGHSFCLEPCLRSLTSRHKGRKIHCPLCRSHVPIPKSGDPRDFPTNFSLQSLLETKKRRNSQPPVKLAKRNTTAAEAAVPSPCSHLQVAEFYCEQCEQFLCLQCAEFFHINGLHSIIAKDTALERARQRSESMVTETLAGYEQKLKTLGQKLQEAKDCSDCYDTQASRLESEVRRAMERSRRTIDQYERLYISEVKAQFNADKIVFDHFTQKWETARANNERILQPLRGILTEVQAGDLSSMDRVMDIGPIDVTCSAMTAERRTLPNKPPFALINGLPDILPKLRRTTLDRVTANISSNH